MGRKFLVAGKGGLNLTHSEPLEPFITRYGKRANEVQRLLQEFGPDDVRTWCHELGIETMVGHSHRVFPQSMKASPLLRRWLERLRKNGVDFRTRHRWQGWNSDGGLVFETPAGQTEVAANAVILSLGGASWPKLGSDGGWVDLLKQQGIDIAPLQASNCGFNVNWSDHFRERYAGEPIKSVVLQFTDSNGATFHRQGSCVVSSYGLEGSLIYAASSMIRDEIVAHGSATISLDLAPDRTLPALLQRLSAPRGSRTMAKYLRSKANLKGVESGLLREFAADALNDPQRLARAIKGLPIPIDFRSADLRSDQYRGWRSLRITGRLDDGKVHARFILCRRDA